ncbi:hypothetical protein PSPO01_09203 [Paraphaeosphaeria sporulosa]
MNLGGRVQLQLMGAFAASRASRWNRRAMEPAFAMRPGLASQRCRLRLRLGLLSAKTGTRLVPGRDNRDDVAQRECNAAGRRRRRVLGWDAVGGRDATCDGSRSAEWWWSGRAAAGVRWQRLGGQLEALEGEERRGGEEAGSVVVVLGVWAQAALVPMTPDVWLDWTAGLGAAPMNATRVPVEPSAPATTAIHLDIHDAQAARAEGGSQSAAAWRLAVRTTMHQSPSSTLFAGERTGAAAIWAGESGSSSLARTRPLQRAIHTARLVANGLGRAGPPYGRHTSCRKLQPPSTSHPWARAANTSRGAKDGETAASWGKTGKKARRPARHTLSAWRRTPRDHHIAAHHLQNQRARRADGTLGLPYTGNHSRALPRRKPSWYRLLQHTNHPYLWLICVRAPQLAEATHMPILPLTGCYQAGFAALPRRLCSPSVWARRHRPAATMSPATSRHPRWRLLFAMCDQLEPPAPIAHSIQP